MKRPSVPSVTASVLLPTQHLDAEGADAAFEQARRERVELELHEAVGEMDHRDLDAALAQAAGGLQAEQATADHHGAPRTGRGFADRAHVRQGAEREHARAMQAGDGRNPRRGAGGEHQVVVLELAAVGEFDGAGAGVDPSRRRAEPESTLSGRRSASRSSDTSPASAWDSRTRL